MYLGKNELRKELACSMPCGREGDLSVMIQLWRKLVDLVNI